MPGRLQKLFRRAHASIQPLSLAISSDALQSAPPVDQDSTKQPLSAHFFGRIPDDILLDIIEPFAAHFAPQGTLAYVQYDRIAEKTLVALCRTSKRWLDIARPLLWRFVRCYQKHIKKTWPYLVKYGHLVRVIDLTLPTSIGRASLDINFERLLRSLPKVQCMWLDLRCVGGDVKHYVDSVKAGLASLRVLEYLQIQSNVETAGQLESDLQASYASLLAVIPENFAGHLILTGIQSRLCSTMPTQVRLPTLIRSLVVHKCAVNDEGLVAFFGNQQLPNLVSVAFLRCMREGAFTSVAFLRNAANLRELWLDTYEYLGPGNPQLTPDFAVLPNLEKLGFRLEWPRAGMQLPPKLRLLCIHDMDCSKIRDLQAMLPDQLECLIIRVQNFVEWVCRLPDVGWETMRSRACALVEHCNARGIGMSPQNLEARLMYLAKLDYADWVETRGVSDALERLREFQQEVWYGE